MAVTSLMDMVSVTAVGALFLKDENTELGVKSAEIWLITQREILGMYGLS